MEERLIELFCAGEALQRCLSSFCADASANRDPILHVILSVLQAPIQLQLTRIGLQLFQGKDLTFPFFRMDTRQKQFLLETLSMGNWKVHDSSMLYPLKGARRTLPPLDVLEAICGQILACKRYSEPKARVAVCNIVLQRVQASIPLSQPLQKELNQRLFPEKEAKA